MANRNNELYSPVVEIAWANLRKPDEFRGSKKHINNLHIILIKMAMVLKPIRTRSVAVILKTAMILLAKWFLTPTMRISRSDVKAMAVQYKPHCCI